MDRLWGETCRWDGGWLGAMVGVVEEGGPPVEPRSRVSNSKLSDCIVFGQTAAMMRQAQPVRQNVPEKQNRMRRTQRGDGEQHPT